MITTMLLACSLTAIDGDTLRCGRERIRLLGIDAPEMPGHCRRGRTCVVGDPVAAKAALAAAIARGPATIKRRGRDRYGRTLARVWAGGVDLSEHMVRTRHAVRVPRWE